MHLNRLDSRKGKCPLKIQAEGCSVFLVFELSRIYCRIITWNSSAKRLFENLVGKNNDPQTMLIFICVHAGCSAVVRLHSAKISCHHVLSKSKHLDFFLHVRLEEIKPNCGNCAKDSAHIFLCSQFVWFLKK